MIWQLTGNKWLDKWIKHFSSFNMELDSSACDSSPLKTSQIRELKKKMEEINSIINPTK